MSQLKLTIVGDPTPLRNATRAAEKSLKQMMLTATKTSGGINKAFGAVGLGIGFASLTNGLKNATKAASEDRKGQGLLAQALQKSVGATSQAIAGAESYIKNTQLQTSVLDDELRPALAEAVRATGSLAGGQRLLDAALDLSASKGKDLGTVTAALSKAFNGQTGSLKKLVPGLKLTDDVLGDIEKGFGGAAETAANLDPYKRLELVFAELQETIGAALLPALEQFTAFIVSPQGQKNLQQIVDIFVSIGNAIVTVTKFLIDNAVAVKAIVSALIVLRVGWTASNGLVALYTALTGKAVIATRLLKYALIASGIGAAAVAVGTLAAAWLEVSENTDLAEGEAESYLQNPAILSAIQETNRMRDEVYANRDKIQQGIKDTADKIKTALAQKIDGIKNTAEKFRDAIGLAFGTFGEDENSVFNVDVVIAKLRRVVQAAKGFAENLNRLRKRGADESVISEIVGMGPAQGNIVAKGLLNSGKLSEYLKLRGSIYNTGAQAGAQQTIAGNATYEINLNGTNVKATDIIREIRILEKKTGRKYLLG
jgi:hypothetical protein